MKNSLSILLTCFYMIIIPIRFANAQAGSLDLTFGTGGKVSTDFDGFYDRAKAVIIQSDGKIIAIGDQDDDWGFNFALVRYNIDGTLDSTFGLNGKVFTEIGEKHDIAWLAALQIDGKIVVAGLVDDPPGLSDYALVRYNSNGTLDSLFGDNGIAWLPFASQWEVCYSVIIQTNGKIVACGSSDNNVDNDIALLRCNSDGSLDTNFGAGGLAITDFGFDNVSRSAMLQPNGKIALAGYNYNGTDYDFLLVRYDSLGNIDSTFGSGGKTVIDFGFVDRAFSSFLQNDGKFLLGGSSGSFPTFNFALARCNVDGSIDTTFGINGKVTTDFGGLNDEGNAVTLQSDGKIIIGGYNFNGVDNDFALARYNIDGSIDSTFGINGKVITDFGNGSDIIRSLAIQSNGSIVAAGESNDGVFQDFALARYNSIAVGLPELLHPYLAINIYPNPVTANLEITFTYSTLSEPGEISIFNVDGKKVAAFNLPQWSSIQKVKLPELRSGIYLARLQNQGKAVNLKFIKQ